jgi:hypothetical protein
MPARPRVMGASLRSSDGRPADAAGAEPQVTASALILLCAGLVVLVTGAELRVRGASRAVGGPRHPAARHRGGWYFLFRAAMAVFVLPLTAVTFLVVVSSW